MNTQARSIRLLLVDGVPGGIITAELANWTGRVLLAPRGRLIDAIDLPEAQGAGVYFLFSEPSEIGAQCPVYIGEGDDLSRNILQHVRDSDSDFERICIITSGDLNLTRTHTRFLQKRLSQIAKASGRADVLNRIAKAAVVLPATDVADLEYFVEQLRLIVPVFGYDILKQPFVLPIHLGKEVLTDAATQAQFVPLTLRPSRKGLRARAVEREGELIVLKGSLAEVNPEFAGNQYRGLRDKLIREEALLPTEDNAFLHFTRDTLFPSPSAAAAVIYGRNANGRTSWELANINITLKEYQNDAGLRMSLGGPPIRKTMHREAAE